MTRSFLSRQLFRNPIPRFFTNLPLLFQNKMDILNEVQSFTAAPHFPYGSLKKGARLYVSIRYYP